MTQSAASEQLETSTVADLAGRARIDSRTTAALLNALPRIVADATLSEAALRCSERLFQGARGSAIAELEALSVEHRFGPDEGLFYLLVALLEIPAAEDRHRACGIDAAISRATWSDLAIWCHNLRKREGRLGLNLEMLAWAQQALTGQLFRIEKLQFELKSFNGPLRAYRHRTTRAVTLLALPGVRFSEDGRMIETEAVPGAWTTSGAFAAQNVAGHPIDPLRARAETHPAILSLEEWEPILSEGDPMLLLHIPADTRLFLRDFVRSIAKALDVFGRLRPDIRPKGAFGDGWWMDPEIRHLMPNPRAIDELCSAGFLYPSRISEANTLRRLFGASATRESVLATPRDALNSLQRSLAEYLSTPGNRLCARGAFILNDRVAELIEGWDKES